MRSITKDYKQMPGGEERLISLNPNQARFGGDLKPTVRVAKQDFKVRTFLVWHAFIGYWGGVDGDALPGYGVRDVGRWFGEFMQPDWDMFQSAHTMGSFHAAGRAVSGSAVYVSDTPDAHDFGVLHKLVLSDGTVLRADGVGRPTRDCLFADVTRDPVLLKVFNDNRDCAVIGVFNANYHTNEAYRKTLEGSVSPSDAPDLKGDEFVAFAHQSDRVWRCQRDDREPVKLAEGKWEIVSFAPVDRGVAALGLADKFNSTGAITAKGWNKDGSYSVVLRDGGEFVAWTEKPPRAAEVNGKPVAFKHETVSGRLSATLSVLGKQTLTLRW